MKILKYILLSGLKGLGHFIHPRRTGRWLLYANDVHNNRYL